MANSLWPHGLLPNRLLCPLGFPRQEYWTGLPFPSPGDLLDPEIKPRSSAWQTDPLSLNHLGNMKMFITIPFFFKTYIVYWLHQRWSYLIQGMSAKVGWTMRKRRRSKVLAAQLCMALWDSMDYSLPDSSVHGILQARILEWVYSLLQGIFLARGSNSCLLHCRQIFLPSQPPVK